MKIKDALIDLKLLAFFFRGRRAQMALVLSIMLIAGALESLNLAAIYPILNYGLSLSEKNVSLGFLNQMVHFIPVSNHFMGACILLIFITCLATGLRILEHFLANNLVRQVVLDNQQAIFNKYKNADYRFFVQNQQGKLIYTGTVATVGTSQNIFYAIRLLNSLITVGFFTLLLFSLSWQSTILIAVMAVVYVFIVKGIISSVINRSSKIAVEEDRRKNVILNEFITGIKAIKVFLSQDYWAEKYNQSVHNSVTHQFKVNMGRILPDAFIKFTFFIILALSGIYLSQISHGNIMKYLPLLGTFAAVMGRFFPYMNLVGNDLVMMVRFLPDTKIVYDILHQDTTQIAQGSKDILHFKNSISFENASFLYPQTNKSILNGMNFKIEKGKITAIVGPSGAGKSTIVNLLFRLYDLESGKITIDGMNIKELKTKSYLSQFGYVGQETFIFNDTIKENIRFGMPNATDTDIFEAAKWANAHEFILNTERGYETVVGDAGVKLSGGQRQRLAIARAMLRKPSILVLDEATSSLDNISEKAVQETINKISKHTTTLIIAHRLSTVQNADKILVLENGAIVEEGTHEKLLLDKKAYYQLFTSSQTT